MGTAKSPKSNKTTAGSGVRVTLRRSPIGTPERHRLALRGLGLRHIRQTAVHPDTPQVRGLIKKVGYLLEVGKP
jgi:large subunit ribosomal protein L30